MTESLCIASRELLEGISIAWCTGALSSLAEACISAALAYAAESAKPDWAREDPEFGRGLLEYQLVVIALGELGGRELGYFAPLDLLLLHGDVGSSGDGASNCNQRRQYLERVCDAAVNVLSRGNESAPGYRVHVRRYTEHGATQGAVHVEEGLSYIERYASPSERQSLVKARPAAGALALGAAFLKALRPLIYPRYFDDATLDGIRESKEAFEAQLAERNQGRVNVRHGSGGLSDIEFTVHMLQQVMGGRVPALRTPETLEALRILGERSALSSLEVASLSTNYAFLRRVVHWLELEDGGDGEFLSGDPDLIHAFAMRHGYDSGAAFMVEFSERCQATRDILERYLAQKGAGNLWVSQLLNPRDPGHEAIKRLTEMGFDDPVHARAVMTELAVGPPQHPYSVHVRRLFHRFAPSLLDVLRKHAHPDITLTRLSNVLLSQRAPAAIYSILKDNVVLVEHLVNLASNSAYLSGILMRDPGLLHAVTSDPVLQEDSSRATLEAQLISLLGAYDAKAAPYRLRDGEMVRIGVRDLTGTVGVKTVGRELTLLAEVVLGHVHAKAIEVVRDRYGACAEGLAIMGLGKMGGREMSYGSDLDLLFVHEEDPPLPKGVSADEYFSTLASRTINDLAAVSRHGRLYEVDMRLRPDGSKGMLVVDAGRIAQYYKNEAHPAERMALAKVRAVGGSLSLGSRIERLLQEVAFGVPFNKGELQQLEEVRGKLAAQAGPLDLKKGEGGIAEAEFTVRLLQNRHAAEFPELMRSDVAGAVDVLSRLNLWEREDLFVLVQAYNLLRRIENRLRMMEGSSVSSVPSEQALCSDLAKRLHLDRDLVGLVQGQRKAVHGIYQHVFEYVSGGAESRG